MLYSVLTRESVSRSNDYEIVAWSFFFFGALVDGDADGPLPLDAVNASNAAPCLAWRCDFNPFVLAPSFFTCFAQCEHFAVSLSSRSQRAHYTNTLTFEIYPSCNKFYKLSAFPGSHGVNPGILGIQNCSGSRDRGSLESRDPNTSIARKSSFQLRSISIFPGIFSQFEQTRN